MDKCIFHIIYFIFMLVYFILLQRGYRILWSFYIWRILTSKRRMIGSQQNKNITVHHYFSEGGYVLFGFIHIITNIHKFNSPKNFYNKPQRLIILKSISIWKQARQIRLMKNIDNVMYGNVEYNVFGINSEWMWSY